MKFFKTRKKLVISGVALTVALLGGGAAFAFWTSSGAGAGSAQVGSTSNLLIDQLGGTPVYNSTIDASQYSASQCFYCVQMGDFGNKINLENGGGPLSDVVVALANFGDTPTTLGITLNIYNPGTYTGPGSAPGSLIATDSETVSVPATTTGYDGTSSDPTAGIDNFNATFNFASQDVTLPGTVVYDIQYNDPQTAANSGVNVQLVNENSQVSVGSDADPGYLFTSLASTANNNGYNASGQDVGPGEITADTVNSTFGEYPTTDVGSGASEQGEAPYVPAVEFDTNTMADLYPGGPGQPVNFSVTNPGTSPQAINSVTVTVTGTSAGAACDASNFALLNGSDSGTASTTYTAGFPQTIPAGGTVDFTFANTGASLEMLNTVNNQDACENQTVNLTFASN